MEILMPAFTLVVVIFSFFIDWKFRSRHRNDLKDMQRRIDYLNEKIQQEIYKDYINESFRRLVIKNTENVDRRIADFDLELKKLYEEVRQHLYSKSCKD